MCPPDAPELKPAPKAPPAPAATADRIESKGTKPQADAASTGGSASSADNLRVDLSVPDSQDAGPGQGGFGSLLAKLF